MEHPPSHRGRKLKKDRRSLECSTGNCFRLSIRVCPVYIAQAAFRFHTKLVNHTEYLLLSITFFHQVPIKSDIFDLKHNHRFFFFFFFFFQFLFQLKSSSVLLLESTGESSWRETKKHTHFENIRYTHLSPCSLWTWQTRERMCV